jgi:hypothetical protein
MDSVLTVAAETETLDSLGAGKAMLVGSHKITVKVCMKPKVFVSDYGVVDEEVVMERCTIVNPSLPGESFQSESKVILMTYSPALELPDSATQTARQMRAVYQVRFFKVDVRSM